MNCELKIRNFKKIKSETVFNNFDFVNYFVGENGSGKTSILNALSFLNDGGNSRHFFGPESLVNLEIDGKNQSLFWNKHNPNKTEHKGNLNPNIFIYASNSSNEKGANSISGISDSSKRLHAGSAEALVELNSFLKEINHGELTAKKYVDQEDPFNQDNGILIYESDFGSVTPSMIADGYTALYNFKRSLKSWTNKFSTTANIILIEEPENFLHPSLQKEIPIILNELLLSLDESIASKTFIFISTHSPFIISSSANFIRQKVFPIQNGKPLKIDTINHCWTETFETSGYSGSDCAYVVSKMLGADVTDIGYPENYCILEEYSLQIILEDARKKGIIRNIQFVSASGASKSIDLSETIYELEKLNTLIKCNPYYFDKYLLIIDSMNNINDVKLKTRIDKIVTKLSNRFIELKFNSLEDYYSNLDQELEYLAKKEIQKDENKNKGHIKAKYAKLISEKVDDKQTFSKLFGNELDILLNVN